MGAQSLPFGLSLKSSTPSIHNPKDTFFHKDSFTTNIQPPKWVSFKTLSYYLASSSSIPLTNARFKCRGSVEKVGTEVVGNAREDDDLRAQVRRKKLGVFVSGGGSNFKSLHQATVDGYVHGAISVLVTNKPDCGGAQFAREKGIPVIVFPKVKDGPGLSANDLVTALRSYEVDFILLAGYLKLIPAELIKAFPRSILNIHPSLLPAFGGKGYYGMKVHKAVIDSGARYSGPSIHYVDEEYDRGRILAQRIVPVLASDTPEELAVRVLHEEHKLYKEVVAALCEERIIWREDGVPLIQSKENPNHYM